MKRSKQPIADKINIPRKQFWVLFSLVLVVGIFFRFHKIKALPCGLAPDEADNAIVALKGKPAFLYNNPGNEPEGFFISTLIIISKVIGLGVWQVYATSALLASFTLILAGLAVKKHFGNLASLLTTFFIATSTWHLGMSQSGTMTITTPLFLSLLLLALPKENNYKKCFSFFIFGIAFGLGFYGYLSYRTVLLLLLVAITFLLKKIVVDKIKLERKKIFNLSISFLMGICLSILPLVIGYIRFPKTLLYRTKQVVIFNQGWIQGFKLFLKNIVLVLRGFFVQGSENWHQNLDSRPFIPWFLILFFAIGLWWSAQKTIKYLRNKHNNLLFALLFPAFFLFLIPDLLTDSTPHGARLNGEIPLIFILIAIGIAKFLITLNKRKISQLFVLLPLCLISILSANLTLQKRYRSQSYAQSYFCEMNEIGNFLKTNNYFRDDLTGGKKSIFLVTGISWYDRVPLDFYLAKNHVYPDRDSIFFIGYDDINSLDPNSEGLIIIPSYLTYNYQRILGWTSEKVTNYPNKKETAQEKIEESYHNINFVYSHHHPNYYWFPENISFLMYKIYKLPKL